MKIKRREVKNFPSFVRKGSDLYDVKQNNSNASFCYTTAKLGKVKFTLEEGCKITRITMSAYKKNGTFETTK